MIINFKGNLNNVGLDEEHVREDDEFGEYGPDRVPTDVEGMKKFVSAFLKRAAEMVELADDVLDEGISLHPDDAVFVELKELKDQMFAARTFLHKPCKYQDPADQTYDSCHTPWNGRTQHEDVVADGDELPFTQLCIELSDRVCEEFHRTNEPQDVPEFKTPDQQKRLNFNDGEDLDLNITQPPATQGKEVGDGQNKEPQEPQDVPEFKTPDQPKRASPKDRSTSRGLSRFGREYLSNENKSMIPVCLEPKPLNVVQPLIPQRRAKRHAILPETSDMLKWEHKKALQKFNDNMELVLGSSQYKRLDVVELVSLFPDHIRLSGSHFFITCMNLKYNRVEYLDNIFSMETDPYARYGFPATQLVALFEDYLLHVNHPSYRQMSVSAKHMILTLGRRTTNNSIDCGVFAMRHMETYRGKGDHGDLCCLKKEGPEQLRQINELQYKYATKILLADCNKAKSKFEQETHAFKTLPVEEKKRLKAEACKKIKQRVVQMLN
ncbi:hypothetical protein Tco_0742010 [Tanacetum coccineum]